MRKSKIMEKVEKVGRGGGGERSNKDISSPLMKIAKSRMRKWSTKRL